jgi:hypothetical protein
VSILGVMKDDIHKFLGLLRLPGRLTTEQCAYRLGFAPHEIPILVKARLLTPLGRPSQQAVKYFAASEIEGLAAKSDFLHRATKTLYAYWHSQNSDRAPRTATKNVPDVTIRRVRTTPTTNN